MIEDKLMYLIDECIIENNMILKRRPDLRFQGDFTDEGKKYDENLLFIQKLKKLPVRIVTGFCSCNNRIRRDEELSYCAWCHKIIND